MGCAMLDMTYGGKDVTEMSLGYCGKCKLIYQDDNIVRYAYSGENWNDKKSVSGDINLLDGVICIYKKCLEEPEIHIKVKKFPSGRKRTYEKRIIHTPSIGKHIAEGEIVVEKKCKNEFQRMKESINDCYLASKLLNHIFEEYQKDGSVPEEVAFIQ